MFFSGKRILSPTFSYAAGLLLLCFTPGIISCSSKDEVVQNDSITTFSRFPIEQRLVYTDSFSVQQLKPDGLLLYNDSVLFIRNTVNTSAYCFSLFHTVSRRFIGVQLETGRKYGQSLSFLSYGLNGNNLWVHDVIKDKIIISDIDSALQKKPGGFHEEPLDAFYYSLQLGTGSRIVATGDYDSPFRIFVLNFSAPGQKDQFIPYTTDSLKPVSRIEKTAYESFLFLKPSGDKCVLACRYADQVEVIDLSAKRSSVTRGPEVYQPAMIVRETNDGKQSSTRGADTRYAFVKGKVTDRYIYLLYSGNNHETEHLYYGKYIYVYDWYGKPVKRLELDQDVLDIAVSRNDSLIYIYEPATRHVKTAKL
ncbi:MAG: hypothetical protein JNM88_09900 [Chitinophagaceae bacterium]|nr:hypothetical protein [Chitinophagaceae bacterium]